MMKCWKRERERPNMANVLNLLKNVTLNTRGMEAKESIRLKAAAKTKRKSGRPQRESSQEPLLATSLTMESDGGESEEGRGRKPAREEKKIKEERRDERRGEENRKSKETKITIEAEVREEVAEEKSKKSGKRDSKAAGKEKSKKGSKKESKKKLVTGDPVPTPVPVVPHKDDNSDISDMDDIFYPSGPPPPAASPPSPPSDDEESWDQRVIPPPHPPSQPPSQRESYRYSKEVRPLSMHGQHVLYL